MSGKSRPKRKRPATPIAGNIRSAQATSGMTNEALAIQVGVSVRVLQKWRAGTVRPTYENLQRVAAALDRPVSWFYSAHEPTAKEAA